MLALSRKKYESIVLSNEITVTVLDIRGDKVRLGIVAPKETPIHRKEIYDAIHAKGIDEAAAATEVVKPVQSLGHERFTDYLEEALMRKLGLPPETMETLKGLDAQLKRLDAEKIAAVHDQDYESAAKLRDQADKLKKTIQELIG